MTTDLVPSVSIENLLSQRDGIAERINEACRLLAEADQLADAMVGPERRTYRRLSGLQFDAGRGRREFTPELAMKLTDAQAWDFLLDKSGLRTLMDAEARKVWDDSIRENDVPELNRASVDATFETMYLGRSEMFERGVLQVFRQLSHDYKTNLPVMFGRRLVLRQVCSSWSRFMSTRPCSEGCHKLDDLIRVMMVLDNKPEPDHRQGAYRTLDAVKWPTETKVANLHGLFTLRGFKNGNAHLTFLRPDLVDKLNKIVAKHFPGALPAARDDA